MPDRKKLQLAPALGIACIATGLITLFASAFLDKVLLAPAMAVIAVGFSVFAATRSTP